MGKRKVSDDLPATVKLQRVAANDRPSSTAAGPFVVHFPSGYAPDDGGQCTWHLYGRENNAFQQAIVARTDKVDFVGKTFAASAEPPPNRMYVGLLDKATGVLQYVPLESKRVLSLAPEYRDDELMAHTTVNLPGQRTDALGSLKEQRARERAAAGRVTAAATAGAGAVAGLLGRVAAEAAAGGRTRADLEAAAVLGRALPPHHAGETARDRAYRLEEIVPHEAWRAAQGGRLRKAACDGAYRQQALENKWVQPYVVARLEVIARAALAAEGEEQAQRAEEEASKALAVLAALLALHAATAGKKALRNDRQRGGVSDAAAKLDVKADELEPWLALFAEVQQRGDAELYSLPKPKRDLLTAYCCVLALLLEPAGTLHPEQFDALRRQLGLKEGEMVKRLREVGAVVSRPGGKGATGRVASLLTDGRTLGESLPEIKSPSKAQAKR